jgi:hypothetical protein
MIVKISLALCFLGYASAQSMPVATLTPATPPTPPAPAFTSTTRGLRYYGDDIKINWAANLGCGACINGGYNYCIQGKEGDDYTGRTVVQTCCKDATAANCPQVSNSSWTCSSTYNDKMTAKGLCPFRSNSCGAKALYKYTSYGANFMDKVNITLLPGETCSLQIATDCGLPMFQPSNTTGFDIEMIDYSDIDGTARRRFLQSLPAKTNTTNTTTTTSNSSNTSTPAAPAPPAPPKRLSRTTNVPKRQFKTETDKEGKSRQSSSDEGVTGIFGGRYKPDFDGPVKRYKGGKKGGFWDLTCVKRNTLVYVTNLQGVNVTVPTDIFTSNSRILQTVPVANSMVLTVGATDFSGAYSLYASFATLMALCMFIMFN